MNLKGLELRSCLEKRYTSSHKHPTVRIQQNMTESLGKKVSYGTICHNFFSSLEVLQLRDVVLADVTITVKTTFQKSHVPCGSEMVHWCGFSICVSGCLEVSVEKIWEQICFFEVRLKKS